MTTWYVRDLSEAERVKIEAHLRSHARRACPMCDSSSISIGGVVGCPMFLTCPGEHPENPLFAAIALCCPGCGFTWLLAATPLLGNIFETPHRLRLVVEDDSPGP